MGVAQAVTGMLACASTGTPARDTGTAGAPASGTGGGPIGMELDEDAPARGHPGDDSATHQGYRIKAPASRRRLSRDTTGNYIEVLFMGKTYLSDSGGAVGPHPGRLPGKPALSPVVFGTRICDAPRPRPP